MVMPILMSIAHYRYLKTKNETYLRLTQLWMKGVAVLFAVGAVSGTVLSFELGLLWPGFMKYAGPIIGMPFSWEGTAFFLEAIAIGLFIYGWKRMHPWVHWASGVFVGVTGFLSGIFVVAANSWMNTPQGFDWNRGAVRAIDPIRAMFNPAWLHETLHMQVAALEAVGFLVAGIHAILLLKKRDPGLNLKAIQIAMLIGGASALVQPVIGHYSAQRVAELQPAKLAAMEAHFKTQTFAPLYIGGFPDSTARTIHGAIQIPGGLSFLAHNSFSSEVTGLDHYPETDWPNVPVLHYSFQLMVALGSWLALMGAAYFLLNQRGVLPNYFVKLLALSTPLGILAVEAGWVVTEVGRQPWIIYNFVRTRDALTPMPGIEFHFALFFIIYILLGSTTAWLLNRQIHMAHLDAGEEHD